MTRSSYEGFVYRILASDNDWYLLESQSRPKEVAHVVEVDKNGKFRCSCEWKEFGNPRCGHERFMKAVLDEKKLREKEK